MYCCVCVCVCVFYFPCVFTLFAWLICLSFHTEAKGQHRRIPLVSVPYLSQRGYSTWRIFPVYSNASLVWAVPIAVYGRSTCEQAQRERSSPTGIRRKSPLMTSKRSILKSFRTWRRPSVWIYSGSAGAVWHSGLPGQSSATVSKLD